MRRPTRAPGLLLCPLLAPGPCTQGLRLSCCRTAPERRRVGARLLSPIARQVLPSFGSAGEAGSAPAEADAEERPPLRAGEPGLPESGLATLNFFW